VFSRTFSIAGMEERRAVVSGGRMRYLVGGNGRPLILLHGIAASSFSFRLNCAELTRRFRVFVPDLINLVPVNGVSNDYSIPGNAQRILEFLDQLGLQKAEILGTSHGGAVIMELASFAPERFQRMILVAPANPFANRYHRILRFYLSPVGKVFVHLVPHMPGRAWDYGIGRMYADPSDMIAGTGLGYARSLKPRGATTRILSSLATFVEDVENLRPKLQAIAQIPTLIIWGDRDPVVEMKSGFELQKQLRAEMVLMKNVGHMPYEERPEEFNRIVIEWLERRSQTA
jgi:pimeloyl-ACP methyl ester carboxylesterase